MADSHDQLVSGKRPDPAGKKYLDIYEGEDNDFRAKFETNRPL
jgi:hypothetical protein